MHDSKSKLTLAVLASLGLAACGGSDSDGGGNNNGGNNNGGSDPVSSITSDVTDLTDRGAWGSLVLSGYGKANDANSDDQLQTEAVPDGVTRWFGGTDNSDSSGSVSYVILAETGEAFRPDEEVQGLTLEGVGSGTTIENVQITNSDDDGIEWFGGAVDLRNVVIQGVTDDSLDQDLGWRGTVKKALVIQDPNFGDRGMETDNNGDDFGASPKSQPALANVTDLGNDGNSDATIGALHREGYGGEVIRSVYADDARSAAGGNGTFGEGCLDVDDELDEDQAYFDVLFNCSAGELASDSDSGANAGNYQADFKNGDGGNYGVFNQPSNFGIDGNTLAVSSDQGTTSEGTGPFVTPNGNSVSPADYFGAVDPSANAPDNTPNNGGPFWDGWTFSDAALATDLPGGDFHPLEQEIRNGTIAPAASNQCDTLGNGLAQGDDVDVFGVTFPVCVIQDGDLDGDFTLPNDHIFLLDGTVQIGNGDVESASDPSTVRDDKLTIQKGTQIMGVSDTDPSLVVTRGAQIQAQGTADQPIVFGAVDAE